MALYLLHCIVLEGLETKTSTPLSRQWTTLAAALLLTPPRHMSWFQARLVMVLISLVLAWLVTTLADRVRAGIMKQRV